ncbi:FAD-dependent oxidoreductase [Halobacillus naozhouensis]|uniref:FAD-dependent monooxygenase n=1 Tax=Halobacillus naozhouensis TaxID=554880 RepID=A0ABY8J4D1_9BACI|nr:FAD-dependent monooxygenase [Halobacillus naozhouensis]WFT76459.1 FAD-dependent monooxygenase [Halobacillus naozhouensis]
MKILIVGGGIAGLSLAGLLRKRGIEPVVVEKVEEYGEVGYFLGLWPLGSRVLHGLDLYEEYVKAGFPIKDYKVLNESGRLLNQLTFENVSEQFGETYLIARYKLLEILRAGIEDLPIQMGMSIKKIKQDSQKVYVTFTNGKQDAFDLVVGADGIHSKVRELLFGDLPLTSTGWGGWGFWLDKKYLPAEVSASEYWGRGKFFGLGQTQQGYSGSAIIPIPKQMPNTREETISFIQKRFSSMGDEVVQETIKVLHKATDLNFLKLSDFKTDQWSKGRVVLIGDSAAGFLPTAGIGASMAMESAAVLNDELSRVNEDFVEQAISLFTKRRRERIDKIQLNSRRLAKMMFTKSYFVSNIRDFITSKATEKQLFKEIGGKMNHPI